uniref:CSC1/OSCA1-like 7TM region domain-containing protein n=1 Tax=Opuntia streptacantha TaxID=393608 RepID=A0A7C9FIQ5_OPUST
MKLELLHGCLTRSLHCLQVLRMYILPCMRLVGSTGHMFIRTSFFAIVLMQITMIGLFGLKSKPAASIATVPLLIFSFLFNEYCKLRFLPSFQHNLVENAGEADELDEKDGRLEINSENAARAYCPPFLTPISSNEAGSSSKHSATS